MSSARIIQGLMQHVKHFYKIQMEVQDIQHFLHPSSPMLSSATKSLTCWVHLPHSAISQHCPIVAPWPPHTPVLCPLCHYLISSNHQSSFDLLSMPAPWHYCIA